MGRTVFPQWLVTSNPDMVPISRKQNSDMANYLCETVFDEAMPVSRAVTIVLTKTGLRLLSIFSLFIALAEAGTGRPDRRQAQRLTA